jgi:HSP20 family molecular chaperone IbpA
MSSFLQKLRGKGVVETEGVDADIDQSSAVQQESPAGVTQLPVDVYQSDREIVIYAQIPGTNVSKLDVSIEGENDVITIQGQQTRPEELATAHLESQQTQTDGANVEIHVARASDYDANGEFSFEECIWGQFFRQIILPQEVDPGHAAAKVKDGVLVLHLPLKEPADNKIRMKVVKMDGHQ